MDHLKLTVQVFLLWCSMPFQSRIKQLSFIENQHQIESDWDIDFGDRKNDCFIDENMNVKHSYDHYWIGLIFVQQIKNWKQNNGKKAMIEVVFVHPLKNKHYTSNPVIHIACQP